ncbi:glycogen synthase [Amycolatopsis acidiphila]|uniref:Glycogen synthase n=1 Tax=Amycolatopsis acidiphila TaxID=715473 RepID=A0A558A9J1_9PSEU|nr:glycogen synthase [Amycolatopsis acidiphila]TVT20925.1 glycogen synthase [Amycolatopsis acidiphila]UIJ62975.1 glycogen synthase [Amycolatopsis acidiphila]GHG65395.1 glycosyl transferase family 1 [Amycolatopsis acidiphila]
MRVGLLTREYPPDVYGGAGVHVEFLARELRSLVDLDVHCWGADRDGAHGHTDAHGYGGPAFATMDIAVSMADALAGHDLAHSHTWYANLAGHLAKLAHGIPHVITAHSLEPLRPWKAEQLGGGYRVSSWIERTAFESADAIIAVSAGMRRDVLEAYPAVPPERVHVVHNGIDTKLYQPVSTTGAVRAHGVDPDRPYVLFVGRITRQKGVPHLVRAAASFAPGTQVVLCAGGADTPELDAEFRGLVAELQAERDGVFWIPEMLPREQVVELLTHAAVFACPSVYEPLGIVNLEAMACGTAVVASDVGGIPEVVEDGVTGLLVHYDERDPAAFEAGLAARVNELVGDPGRAAAMGAAGRTRAVEEFGWAAIAARTVGIYQGSGRSS